MKNFIWIFFCLPFASLRAQQKVVSIANGNCAVKMMPSPGILWEYVLSVNHKTIGFRPPVFEIDGKTIIASVTAFAVQRGITLRNGVTEYMAEGALSADPSIRMAMNFRLAENSPVVRFSYRLTSDRPHQFSKKNGKGHFEYFSVSFAGVSSAKEIRLSDFNEKYHATMLTENPVDERFYEDSLSAMGPILIGKNKAGTFLLAYEHGSQYPDRFLEFQFEKNRQVSLHAVKGNYLDHQPLDQTHDYQTIWFEVAAAAGDEDKLAASYRSFVLKDLTENAESRKPYIFYNTWGRQERVKWAGGTYLGSMNLQTTLKEIEVAHRMGIEVYVLDVGWFQKTGDWDVNTSFFPDSLKQVKALLTKYGMKLGLWFNPMLAARSSKMLAQNKQDVAVLNGKADKPFPIWETEESVRMSLVSPYWEKYADKLISLVKELGVTYFKWDGIGQYGINGTGHFYGNEKNSAREREDSYAFQLPLYMSRIIDRVCRTCPEAIFDFDVTEPGRSVGLAFLSSGKYFIMNNGPYFHSFDLATEWKSPLANGNANMFVNPGPARGWFTRSVLGYDKWIPSVLFLTHYQPDGSENSQIINIASLILGQNGIWGELLKLSPKDIQLFHGILSKYKAVRDDITESDPVVSGETGLSPEIHEKINASTGKGAFVLFANASGQYTYVTRNRASRVNWHNDGVSVHYDRKGRAVIQADFHEPGARIILFGVE